MKPKKETVKWIGKGILLMGGGILFVMVLNWLFWGEFS